MAPNLRFPRRLGPPCLAAIIVSGMVAACGGGAYLPFLEGEVTPPTGCQGFLAGVDWEDTERLSRSFGFCWTREEWLAAARSFATVPLAYPDAPSAGNVLEPGRHSTWQLTHTPTTRALTPYELENRLAEVCAFWSDQGAAWPICEDPAATLDAD